MTEYWIAGLGISACVIVSVGWGVGACVFGHAWKTEDVDAPWDHRYCTRCDKCQWKVKNTTNWITV